MPLGNPLGYLRRGARGGARTSRAVSAMAGDSGIAARTAMHSQVGRASAHRTAVNARASVRAGRGIPGTSLVPFTGTGQAAASGGRFDRFLGAAGTRRRTITTRGLQVGGGVMGASLGMNAVLGPRPPSSGRNGLAPGGTSLPY